jgi:hypothetical protein
MIWGMDLKVPWKALSNRGAFSSRRVVFFVVAGLSLVVGIFLRSGQYFGQPDLEQNAPVRSAPQSALGQTPAVEPIESVPKTPLRAQKPVTTPNEHTEQASEVVEQVEEVDDAVEHAGQPDPPVRGMILVSRQPIAMLASPSSSAPTVYGFPAGRPFRVIGRDAGFAHIQDLKSNASGWIDEAALAPPPSAPAVSRPSQTNPVAVNRNSAKPSPNPRPKATKKDSQVAVGSEAPTARKRPGLFGRGGAFRSIFGNGN